MAPPREEENWTGESESLPFLGEERVGLLGCGADPHSHFTHGPFPHSALENWHPDDESRSAGLSSRSATNDRRDDTLPITLRHRRVLRPSTTTRRTSHSIHVAIGMARLILPHSRSRTRTIIISSARPIFPQPRRASEYNLQSANSSPLLSSLISRSLAAAR